MGKQLHVFSELNLRSCFSGASFTVSSQLEKISYAAGEILEKRKKDQDLEQIGGMSYLSIMPS
jgi:hypothetical protein